MKHYFFCCIFMLSTFCFSQQKVIDSIENIINSYEKPDTTYVNLRVSYTAKNLFLTPSDTTWLDYNLKTLDIAKQLNYKRGMVLAQQNIGVIYQYLLSDPLKAIDNYQKSMALIETDSAFKKYAIGSLYNIGNIYFEQQEFRKALHNYKKALQISPRNINIIANIGNIYGSKNSSLYQPDSSIYFFKKAYKKAKKTNNYLNQANILSNLSLVQSRIGKIEEAKSNIKESLYLIDKYNFELIRTTAYTNAAMVYLESSDYEKSEQYALEVLSLNKSLKNLFTDKAIWETLTNIYEEKKDYKKALDAYQKAVKLNDSITDSDRKLEISRKEIQFKADKDQAIAQAEVERQKLIKNTYIIVGSGLALVSLIGFVLYRRKQEALSKTKEAEFNLKVSDTELKALRAQMNPHFIFNSLTAISSYISKNNIESANEYLADFAHLMRQILENSEKEEVLLSDDISIITSYLNLESIRFNNKFTYQIVIDSQINPENTLVLPLILQPFIENSIIHGFPSKYKNGHINIGIKKSRDMILYVVDDNGVGRQKSIEKKSTPNKKSLGMKITKNRIDIINQLKNAKGNLKIIDKEKGTRIEITLPLELVFKL